MPVMDHSWMSCKLRRVNHVSWNLCYVYFSVLEITAAVRLNSRVMCASDERPQQFRKWSEYNISLHRHMTPVKRQAPVQRIRRAP